MGRMAPSLVWKRPEQYALTVSTGIPSWAVDTLRLAVGVYVLVVGVRLMVSGVAHGGTPFYRWEKVFLTAVATLVAAEAVLEFEWRGRGGGGERTHFHPLLLLLANSALAACLVAGAWTWSVRGGELIGTAISGMGIVALAYTSHLVYVRAATRPR